MRSNIKHSTQCFITRWNTSLFVKNTPQRVVFSQMKHCVSCSICNSLLTNETLHLMLDILGFQYELNAVWYSSQDPSDFQAAFDELVQYTSSADNWRQIKDELSGRGVWFIVLFFIFTSLTFRYSYTGYKLCVETYLTTRKP